MSLRLVSVVFAAAVVSTMVLSMAGCPRPAQATGCQSDFDCGASQACNVARGQCVCIDDNACDATEFCNIAGSCQVKLECLNNSDCESNQICNTTDGSCIARAANVCVQDSHCPYGSFCAQNRACTPGCNDSGDCPLGIPCLNGTCDETPGACDGNSFCEFGQRCVNNRCQNHPDRNQLCATCSGTTGLPCAEECLIDNSVAPTLCTNSNQCPGTATCAAARCQVSADCPGNGSCFLGTCSTSICQGFFCGSENCSEQNPCPRGYACNQLQLVSGVQCTLGNNATCGANRACRGGGELGSVGFCSCASNADCPRFNGEQTTCANPGENGACIIGTICGPADGLLCEDLR